MITCTKVTWADPVGGNQCGAGVLVWAGIILQSFVTAEDQRRVRTSVLWQTEAPPAAETWYHQKNCSYGTTVWLWGSGSIPVYRFSVEEQLWWVITAVPTQKLYMKDGTSFSVWKVLNLRCFCWPAGGESSGCNTNLCENEPTVHWWLRGLVTTLIFILIFDTYSSYWYFITEKPEPHITTCRVNESVGGVMVVTSIFCIQSVLWREAGFLSNVVRSLPSDCCCDLGP